VPEGQKSLAIEVTLQPGEKSYDEAELKAIAEKVTAAAAKLLDQAGRALRQWRHEQACRCERTGSYMRV
jgi:hypothetical protein